MTDSLFQRAAALLSVPEGKEALDYISRRKDASKYLSVMDFLFCELFTAYRKHCKSYYENKGPSLKEIVTEKQADYFENSLVRFLILAEYYCQKKIKISWTEFSKIVILDSSDFD